MTNPSERAREPELLARELPPSDDDLIRRGDALEAIKDAFDKGRDGRGGIHCAVVQVPAALTPTPAGSGEIELVDGPVSQDCNGDWTAEIQAVGGHSVIAHVYGETEQDALAMRDSILSALSRSPVTRDGVIEECAKVAHDYKANIRDPHDWFIAVDIAALIRQLKDKGE